LRHVPRQIVELEVMAVDDRGEFIKLRGVLVDDDDYLVELAVLSVELAVLSVELTVLSIELTVLSVELAVVTAHRPGDLGEQLVDGRDIDAVAIAHRIDLPLAL
jgi:hypothetical protein